MSANQFRLIAGKWRGKTLSFPPEQDLRPTLGRIRETLFNWLMHDIQTARCLDAFAGSGAIGLEALSRQAKEVTFLDSNKKALAQLKQNINTLAEKNATVLHRDALNFLKTTDQTFDIIFLDPPFQEALLADCLNAVQKNNVLTVGGLIYIEHNRKTPPDLANWQILRQKKAGQVTFALLTSPEKNHHE
jgi:16S rRNA (guanine966-N2)-methyltransferase